MRCHVLLALSVLVGCRGADPGPVRGAGSVPTPAKASAAAPSAPDARDASTPERAPTLALREDAPLAVQLLDDRTFEAASRKRSVHGNLLLAAKFDTFRVFASPSEKIVAASKGATARWVAPTVVAFVEPKGTIAAVDVASEARTRTTGGDACAGGTACGRDRLPVLLWASADLEHALVKSLVDVAVFDVQRGKTVRLFEGPFERGEAVDVAVGPTGSACALVGRTRPGLVLTSGDGGAPEPGVAELHCAEPAWAPPKKIRDFPVPDVLERASLGGGAHVQFSGDREVLVSVPTRPTAPGSRAETLRHCVVALAGGTTRCTEGERPTWEALGDGRYALEEATSTKPASLVDLTEGRTHPLGTKPAPWRYPQHDARDPAKLVVQRLDQTPDWRGSVLLP